MACQTVKQILQKVLCLLTAHARFRQTDRQTDGNAVSKRSDLRQVKIKMFYSVLRLTLKSQRSKVKDKDAKSRFRPQIQTISNSGAGMLAVPRIADFLVVAFIVIVIVIVIAVIQ